MSPLSTLGPRPFQAPAPGANAFQTEAGKQGQPAGVQQAGAAASAGPAAVSLSQNGLDLSAQGLAQRADALGNATIDVAQDFIAGFAQKLFGAAAEGATLSFDSASLKVEAGYGAAARHSESARGVEDALAFSLNESAHFLGKGSITTADGQTFDFEIEVQYDARLEAAATHGSSAGQDATAPAALPSAQLGKVDFPGSLDDLFALLGHQLESAVPAPADADAGADQGGALKLRLLRLINDSSLLAPASEHAQRASLLADAYGAAAPAETPAATVPPAAEAEAGPARAA